MLQSMLYIGPSLGAGTITVVFVVLGLVAFSLGYIIWLKIKNIFKKNK